MVWGLYSNPPGHVIPAPAPGVEVSQPCPPSLHNVYPAPLNLTPFMISRGTKIVRVIHIQLHITLAYRNKKVIYVTQVNIFQRLGKYEIVYKLISLLILTCFNSRKESELWSSHFWVGLAYSKADPKSYRIFDIFLQNRL